MQAWVEEELMTSDLGDERLNERYTVLLDRFRYLLNRQQVQMPLFSWRL